MRFRGRAFSVLLILILVSTVLPGAAIADEHVPMLLGGQVVVTTGIPETPATSSLMVQATAWDGFPYRYVITISNFTRWPLTYMRVLDRYLPADPYLPEIDHEWISARLEPGQVASFVVELAQGALPNGCHQIEIQLADGLDTILMDCSSPSSTTIWQVPISDAMEAYLSLPPLTLEQPEGQSKMGLHVTHSSPEIMAFVRDAQPAVVAAVDDLGWLSEVKALSPRTITVGRFMEDNQAMVGDPVERAREYVTTNAARYLAHPAVDYWMGWNEPVIDSPEAMMWYVAFESERVRALAELGLKAAIGNFSVGTPEADAFAPFLEAIRVAKEHGGVLALHEYSAPTMRDGVGAGIPGLASEQDSGALTLRYRYWYQHYLLPNDLVLPLIITEAGIDGGVLRAQGDGRGGWRDFVGDGSDSGFAYTQGTSSYLDQLSWYDDELRRDLHVVGFAIFNAGEPSGKWSSFDVTELLPQLTDLANSKQ